MDMESDDHQNRTFQRSFLTAEAAEMLPVFRVSSVSQPLHTSSAQLLLTRALTYAATLIFHQWTQVSRSVWCKEDEADKETWMGTTLTSDQQGLCKGLICYFYHSAHWCWFHVFTVIILASEDEGGADDLLDTLTPLTSLQTSWNTTETQTSFKPEERSFKSDQRRAKEDETKKDDKGKRREWRDLTERKAKIRDSRRTEVRQIMSGLDQRSKALPSPRVDWVGTSQHATGGGGHDVQTYDFYRPHGRFSVVFLKYSLLGCRFLHFTFSWTSFQFSALSCNPTAPQQQQMNSTMTRKKYLLSLRTNKGSVISEQLETIKKEQPKQREIRDCWVHPWITC